MLAKVKEELVIVHENVMVAKAQAHEYEGEAMHALTLWGLLSQRLAG